MPDSSPRPPAIRFGVFEVDLRSGELHKDGLKIKLQEQPFQILAMLLEHPGEIVTREELQKALWSTDTFVDFEHGLNKAINKIREALDDSADNPRFVETLARRGYRFIAPVVGATRGVAQGEAAPRPYKVLALAAGIVIAALAALFALNVAGLRDRLLRKPVLPMRVVPFTSFPGQEILPRFSPDGNQIAFGWNGEKEDNWDIFIKLIGAERPLRLTTHSGFDFSPAWSPDGRQIAFCRHAPGNDEVIVVPAIGGPERKLYSRNMGAYWPSYLDWSPDGKYLAFGDRQLDRKLEGILFLSVDNPQDRRLITENPVRGDVDRPTVPQTRTEEVNIAWAPKDCFPRFSPDGQTLAFARWIGQLATDLYAVRVAGGEPRRLTFDNALVGGLDWTPDGAYIIFFSTRNGQAGLWKIRPSGGEPEPVGVGLEMISFPSLSHDGRKLAYARATSDSNIWRYEIGGRHRAALPIRLIASTAEDLSQQISPDGKRIVFASGRSGSGEIWVCDGDGSNPRQVTSLNSPAMAGTPRWSPDGREISFDFSVQGHADIYAVSAEGGPARRITAEPSNDVTPSWSRDGKWIYFASDRTGTWQTWKTPAGGGRAVQVTKEGGFAAFESTDGKTLYYAKGLMVPGLWKVPVEGGEETPVLEQLAAGLWGYWGLTKDGIYFYNLKTKAIEFFSFVTRHITQVARPEKEAVGYNPGLAVSPDGRWILYAQVDQETSDIMLVENFRW